MNLLRLITRSLLHYPAAHLATAAGIAISTAIICGALIIGDSLGRSLLQVVDNRLGQSTHSVTAGERIFTQGLARRMEGFDGITAAPMLKTEAVLTNQESGKRIGKVQLWGVDSMFIKVTGGDPGRLNPGHGEAILSRNLAESLGVDTGDFVLVRIRKTGPIPPNTPFVSEGEQTVARRIRVAGIASAETAAHFNLRASQSAPLNVFVTLDWLNGVMDLQGMANLVLLREDAGFSDDDIKDVLRQSWQPADGALKLAAGETGSPWKITSDRVFIDHYLSDRITETFPDAARALTYFVNGIAFGDRETPYSFVAATDYPELQAGRHQVIITEWLAADLGAGTGDSLRMRYFEVGPLRELTEKEDWFVVSDIISMDAAKKYAWLMPELPGLSDAGSCSEWETGIPVDLDAIRQQDEDYWDEYRGTPKAFVALDRGMALWQNRFGNMTSFMIREGLGERPDTHEGLGESSEISERLAARIDPVRLEFQVNPVHRQGVEAARGGVDFSQLFAGLGIFIVAAGWMLTALFLGFGLKKREGQLRLFAFLGFPERLIRRIMLGEAAVVTLLGAGMGLLLSVGYSRLVFGGLNRIWHDIVRTEVLHLHFDLTTLVVGLASGIILGLGVVAMGVRKSMRKSMVRGGYIAHKGGDRVAQARGIPTKDPAAPAGKRAGRGRANGRNRLSGFGILFPVSAGLLILSLSTALILLLKGSFAQPFPWFMAGGSLLLSMLAATWAFLHSPEDISTKPIDLNRLSWKNIRRNPLRSFTIVALLAMGSFVIVVTAANRRDLAADAFHPSGGTGGFWFMAETTAPVLRNLNLSDTRLELGIPDEVFFVQFHSAYDDDASCLNLNRVENPRILAADPCLLSGRFSFVSAHPMLDPDDPWRTLEKQAEGVIPAIADQSVIQWGLGLKVGDTLNYLNAAGEEVRLLLVGGLANSVFQGNVVISDSHFLRHFPASGGTDVFLVGPEPGNGPAPGRRNGQPGNGVTPVHSDAQQIYTPGLAEELEFIFRDHGWEMIPADEKLAAFNSVENTYLSIFFLMGAFGMLLGTGGLAIILAKSMLERRNETALMKAVGFTLPSMVRLFATEYLVLFVAGLLGGFLPALLATLPVFLEGSQNVPAGFLAGVTGLLVLNGVFWIGAISVYGVRSTPLMQSLQNE